MILTLLSYLKKKEIATGRASVYNSYIWKSETGVVFC
jgi:hypothetical protein